MAGLWIGGRHTTNAKAKEVGNSSRPNSQDGWVTVDGEDDSLATQVKEALSLSSNGDGKSGSDNGQGGEAQNLEQELREAREKMAQLEAKCASLGQRCTRADEDVQSYKTVVRCKEEEVAHLRAQLVLAKSEAEAAKLEASHLNAALSAGTAAGRDADTLAEELEAAKEREQLWKIAARSRISYTSFEPGDFALFLPTSNGFFVAFNKGCPFRYLSSESLEAAKAKCGEHLSYVVGPLIEISESQAMDEPNCNPYGLPIGTPYHVCTVAVQ
mmetsp:Transcript_8518/g.19896  ORF Transcript_8518/g.19896 Transcript_8518/m.19896 type:complete len:271 (-) Transcript_8518:205-1017(-)|eukprot:CAMPEP_0114118602 /NCGR_PEP_ID=MMETSP0043_2-20121206/5665_1 /TAXON_ID=464988 /ORGANISM="Hemiselmis andersenii, Strain CCMP644" /LENGTH=270 /DNA_ID=CAMNT_0001211093 /DNA_START=262 /DNA_END=1074 /DNA_ORIENTATION=-